VSEAEEVTDTHRRTDILAQIADGTQPGGPYALRTFPVYCDNHFHRRRSI
jgi:hypothetical protein